MSSPRPRVTLHFAQSLDGKIALGPGRPRVLLSSPEGLQAAHRARAEHQAVLVGIQTVLLDDPRLTVRACAGPHPVRVVLDSALRLPPGRRLLAPGDRADVIVIGAEGRATDDARARLEAEGVVVMIAPAAPDGRVSLRPALVALRARGIERLLVEGGREVLSSFVRERVVDAVSTEIVPCLLGAPALGAFGALGFDGLGEAMTLSDVRIERVGANLLVRGEVTLGEVADASAS